MLRTAIVYDPFNLRHTQDGHPENHRRLVSTTELLQDDGILDRLIHLPSAPAPLETILKVHAPGYIARLQAMHAKGGGHLDGDTYLNDASFEAALRSAGGALALVDGVLSRQVDNGFSLGRPPGHHALAATGMGFCLFANAAIAARHAQLKYGVKRVLIVDFDVHHGNGTQDIFYDDPNILFFSAHQFPYYPGTGAATEMGSEHAYGATVNVPFPARVGDAGYIETFQYILAPIARRFQPELIILSAGYDGHWMDPLASMGLSITGYMALVQELMELADELCGGRLVALLEGGYHLDVLSHSVLSTFRVLRREPVEPSDPFGPMPGDERNVSALLSKLKVLHGIRDTSIYTMPSRFLDWGDDFGF